MTNSVDTETNNDFDFEFDPDLEEGTNAEMIGAIIMLALITIGPFILKIAGNLCQALFNL